jgi:hypothetical protein
VHQDDISSYVRYAILIAVKKHNCNGHGERSDEVKGWIFPLDAFQIPSDERRNKFPDNEDVFELGPNQDEI